MSLSLAQGASVARSIVKCSPLIYGDGRPGAQLGLPRHALALRQTLAISAWATRSRPFAANGRNPP